MPILLKYGTIYYKQGDIFQLNKGDIYFSTKVDNSKKGRWYYEATHYSGSGFHLFGFSFGVYCIYFYQFNSSIPFFYATSLSESTRREKMNFPIEQKHTIGLGIDTYNKMFTVFYNNTYESFKIPEYVTYENLNVKIWGANSNFTDDFISVNFGEFPFDYNVPGFHPWNEKIYQPSYFLSFRNKNIYI